MYLTHLLLVVQEKAIIKSYCVGLNMCYLDNSSQLLYEHAGTKESFSVWLDQLKLNHKQKIQKLVCHGEKAEIVFIACDSRSNSLSFAEKVVAKGIKTLGELRQFNEGRTLLRGLMFDLNTQLWTSFMYEDGAELLMNELEMPNTVQQNLF